MVHMHMPFYAAIVKYHKENKSHWSPANAIECFSKLLPWAWMEKQIHLEANATNLFGQYECHFCPEVEQIKLWTQPMLCPFAGVHKQATLTEQTSIRMVTSKHSFTLFLLCSVSHYLYITFIQGLYKVAYMWVHILQLGFGSVHKDSNLKSGTCNNIHREML